ncbi:Dihydrolipoyllysine-residue acetyltransferase component of pyruvate dehydrogenase complex [compost metagenome]
MGAQEQQPVLWPANLPPMPQVDFSQFGETETVNLSRNQVYAGAFLGRNWAQIPHVTHHDEAHIDALLAERLRLAEQEQRKLSLLPFQVKALVNTLKAFPQFNASLAPNGKQLVLKRYFNIGIAVDTPNGLLVPVIRDADRKSIVELADEIADKARRAREKGLPISEMSGGCMTISSLSSLGGTAFTPIINAPELAILGISSERDELYLDNGAVRSRRVLPLSLSYDHRVINGADAARFCRHLANQLANPAELHNSGNCV